MDPVPLPRPSRRAVLGGLLAAGCPVLGTPAASAAPAGGLGRSGWFEPTLPGRAATVARFAGRAPGWFDLAGEHVVSSFDSADEVVLTFDACGGSLLGYDEELIEVLRRTGTPATLFVNRSWALHNWRIFTELARDPLFEIANHGDRHVPLSVTGRAAYGILGTASVEEAYDEIARAHRLFDLVWGVRSRWFRPGTAHTDDVCAEMADHMGTPVVGFTVNGDAGATAPAASVTEACLGLQPGGIVLAHMNHPGSGTAAGVEAAIPRLRAAGLTFTTLGEVLG